MIKPFAQIVMGYLIYGQIFVLTFVRDCVRTGLRGKSEVSIFCVSQYQCATMCADDSSMCFNEIVETKVSLEKLLAN